MSHPNKGCANLQRNCQQRAGNIVFANILPGLISSAEVLMRVAAHSIEAFEIRRLLAGTAPDSIAGDTFIMDFNGGAEIVNAGVYQLLVAPASNVLFIDNIQSTVTGYDVVDTYAAG